MNLVLNKTTLEERQLASISKDTFSKASSKLSSRDKKETFIKVEKSGEFIQVPSKLIGLISDIITSMSEGKSVALIDSDSELTTQQAADIIRVSRPHLIKLLETGEIPHRKVGTHRRIVLSDLLNYQESQKKKREMHLGELVQQAQDLNLGYE